MNLLFSNYYTMSSNKKIYALVIAILLCSTNINAQKAYTSGVSVSRATKVMEILQLYGYYDDKKLPKVLEH